MFSFIFPLILRRVFVDEKSMGCGVWGGCGHFVVEDHVALAARLSGSVACPT